MYARYLADGGGDATTVLVNWAVVVESDHFWRYIEDRAHDVADPRLTTDAVAEIIPLALPAQVLEPVAHEAAALIDDGDLDAAANLIRALRQSGNSRRKQPTQRHEPQLLPSARESRAR